MSIVILNLKKISMLFIPLIVLAHNSLQVHKNKTLKIDWRSSNLETCIQWNAIFALVRSCVFVLLLGCWHFFFAVNDCLTYPEYLQVSIIKRMHFSKLHSGHEAGITRMKSFNLLIFKKYYCMFVVHANIKVCTQI